jgi:Predicted integral membrane protein (DUF2269)
MSFGDKAILWLHLAAVIFTIGPGTAAIMSTPRYIRNRNPVVVGFLFRTTRIYSFGSLLVLVFGLILTGMTHKFSQWWISVSLTLFVVAFILLLLILRDQRRAITLLDAVPSEPALAAAGGTVADAIEDDVRADADEAAADTLTEARVRAVESGQPAPADARTERRVAAAVERGRIASLGGVTSLIWLVILVLMVWH